MSVLHVADLTVFAADRALLGGVDFSVAPGQIIALVGPSGLGKSRLLRAVAALDDATGRLTFDDKTPAEWGYPAWRRTVVLVQQRGVMLDGTVRANLDAAFAFAIAGPPPPRSELVSHLAALGLDASVLDQLARRLSIGQAQRVSLIRALLTRPRVLLLDEPTAGLDPVATLQVEAAIGRACAAGARALLVSHDPDQPTRLGATVLDLAPYAVEASHAG